MRGQTELVFIDSNDSLPLPGVVITLPNYGTINADAEGKVMVPALCFQDKDSLLLELRLVGYETRPVYIQKGKNVVGLMSKDHTMNAVVITAQHDAVRADQSIHRMRVIDRKRIDQLAAVNLEDVLVQEMNIRIGQDAILGSSLTIQGMGGSNVKILMDGVPVIGRTDGNIDLRQINLANVERIEVVQGPLSVQFGSDAIAGTINIITKKEGRSKWDVLAKSYAESVGTLNNQVSVQRNFKFGYVAVDGFRNQFDGWTSGEEWQGTFKDWRADSSRVRTWKPRLQHGVTARAGWNKKGWRMDGAYQLFDELIINRGAPRAPFGESAFDDTYKTLRSDARLTMIKKWNERWESNQVFGYNQYNRRKNTYVTDLTSLDQTLVTQEGAQDTARFDLWMSRGAAYYNSKTKKWSTEMGYDVSYESTIGRRISDREQSILDAAIFASAMYHVNAHWTLKPGLRAGYNSAYEMPVIPSFQAMWNNGWWSWRASYANGFRAPSLKELYFFFVDVNHNIQGSQELSAERSHQFQTAFSKKTELKNWFGKTELVLFYNRIQDLISLAQVDATLYSYVNIGRYETAGFNIEQTIYKGNWKGTLAYGGNVRESSDFDGSLFTQEGSASLGWYNDSRTWNVQAFARWLGGNPNFILNENDEVELARGEGYTMIDANVQRYFLEKALSLSVGVKNALDVQAVNLAAGGGAHSSGAGQSLVAMGRYYFISLQYNFKK